MGLTATLSAPFFTGGVTADVVPQVWPVAIDGRPYMIDTLPETFYVRWNIETIPLIRQQADQSKSPAEATLNPSGFWRRAQDSFHHGAGQTYRDRDDAADEYRFDASKGINVWTRYQATLLADTDQKLSSANTNIKVVAAGARLYYADGSTVKYTADVTVDSPTWNSVTYAGGTVKDICSDGFNVYVTDGSNIYVTNTGSSTLTSTDTTDADVCAYVKSRFMCAKGNILYNIPTLGSATNKLTYTHPNSGFTWVGFADGTANIFAAGFAGDKSLIYRIAIKPDGTALDVPIVCGELPDGEIVRSISGYLGFVFLGTDKGVRFCEVDAEGNLTIGAVISTPSAVQAFEPQDRFMWFGWSNYDTASTGLGRLDISQFTDTLVPAYASDLMVTGQGAILSAATFNNLRVFTISGLGIYAETSTLVASGTLTTGLIGFGLPDPKTAIYLHTDFLSLVGTIKAELAGTTGAYVTLGTSSIASTTTDNFPANNLVDERYECRFTLTRASSTTGPTFLRWTLKVIPTTDDGFAELYHIPLMLYPKVRVHNQDYEVDVEYEREYLSSLRATRKVVTCQYFTSTMTGIITDFKEYPYGLTDDEGTGDWTFKSTHMVDFQRIS